MGVSVDGKRIENGLERLQLPALLRAEDLDRWNERAIRRMTKLGDLGRCWEEAIGGEAKARVLPRVEWRASQPPTIRPYVFGNTLRYLLYAAFYAFMAIFSKGVEVLRSVEDSERFQWGLLLLSVLGLIYAAPRLYQSIRVAIRHAPVAGTLHQIALVVRDALSEAGVLQTAGADLRVSTLELYPGIWSVSIIGKQLLPSTDASERAPRRVV